MTGRTAEARGRGWLDRVLWRSFEVHRALSAALVLLAPATGFALSRVSSAPLVGFLLFAQLVIAGGTWYVGDQRSKALEEEHAAARGETLLDLGHSLEPLVREIGRVSALKTEGRRREESGLKQAVLAAATGLNTDNEHLRACYFKLQRTSEGGRTLSFDKATGRAIAAKAEFKEGTVAGDAALSMVDSNGHLFCDDVKTSPPPGWEQSERGDYRTFISVTVGTPGEPVGMLTLDAPRVGALTSEDVRMLIVLGHLLGLAEVLAA